MPILGIDYNKCIDCGTCLTACLIPGKFFKRSEEQEKMIFEDPENICILCGHCIGQCPEDAIIYENMGESFTFAHIESPEDIFSFENIFDFLSANRSVRRYKKDKVPVEVLQKVFKAMDYAPVGGNNRIEKFFIISDTEKIKALSDAIQNEFRGGMMKELLDTTKKVYNSPVYFDAPHIILVTTSNKSALGAFNLGILGTYAQLAAQALGLGTCWNGMTQLAMESNPKIKKLANIRGNVVGAFTIGYPDLKYYRVPPRFKKEVNGME